MADDLKARLGQNFFVEIDGKRYVDDTPQIARDRITALEDHARALARELNADGDLTGGPLEMRLRAIVRKILKHHNAIDGVIEADIVSGILRVAFEEYQKIMGDRK